MRRTIFSMLTLSFIAFCFPISVNAQSSENDLDYVMTILDEGFLNMFSFGPTAWNKEQCREGFQDVFDTYSIEGVEYESVEIIVDQNYAFETQLFKQKWITNDKQDTTHFDMRTMTVFKKQEDGNWKISRLMGQHNQNL